MSANKKYDDYTILINSCDAYSDAWEPFFKILAKTWPECKNKKIVLNTETKEYQDPFFDVEVIHCTSKGLNKAWGKRLRDVLQNIESDYIFFMLEDYFFEKKIDDELVEKYFDILKKNPQIDFIALTSPMECNDIEYCNKLEKESTFKGLVARKKRGYFKLNAGPGLWRKNALLHWTFEKDTPWEWEFFGSMRTWHSKREFWALNCKYPPLFVYDIEHGGAIHRGKWVGYKIKELEMIYGIRIDTSKREVEENWLDNPIQVIPKWKRIPSIIHNRTEAIKNQFLGRRLSRNE